MQEKARLARCRDLQKWKTQSAEVRSKFEIPSGSSAFAWTERKHVRLAGLPHTEHVLDTINTCWAVARKRNPAMTEQELISCLHCSVSQSVRRLPYTLGVPTPATSTRLYSYSDDAIVTHYRYMRYMGWPENLLPARFSAADWTSLGGNAFSVPCAGFMTVLMYMNPWGPLWSEPAL